MSDPKVKCRICKNETPWSQWLYVGEQPSADDGFKLVLKNCPKCPDGRSNTQSMTVVDEN